MGGDVLAVNRNLDLQAVLSKALNGTAAEKTISLHGGHYQADASPVFSDGAVSGAALLLFDVTEREQAEQMRREFTANVSRELCTPLTSISGCAELLKSGLVKPEDVRSFGENIYREAQRMVRLVTAVIRGEDSAAPELSRPQFLDENVLSQPLAAVSTGNQGITAQAAQGRGAMHQAQKRFNRAHLAREKDNTCDASLTQDYTDILYGFDRAVDNCVGVAEEVMDGVRLETGVQEPQLQSAR